MIKWTKMSDEGSHISIEFEIMTPQGQLHHAVKVDKDTPSQAYRAGLLQLRGLFEASVDLIDKQLNPNS